MVSPAALGPTPDGGLLIASWGDRSAVVYKPRGETAWPLVALRDTRVGHESVDAVIETTRPGVAVLELLHNGRVVARVRSRVGRGHWRLRITGRPSPRIHTLRVGLEVPGAATARDEVKLLTAQQLTLLQAKALQSDSGSDDPAVFYRIVRCRRFGLRRVDCESRILDESADDPREQCEYMTSLMLQPSGVILSGDCPCGNRRRGIFRQHPPTPYLFPVLNSEFCHRSPCSGLVPG